MQITKPIEVIKDTEEKLKKIQSSLFERIVTLKKILIS